MRVLFITGNYLPSKNGGIENYTHWLAKSLIRVGVEVHVAALFVNEKLDYIHDAVSVHFIGESLDSFKELLHQEVFDICHFMEYSEFGGIEIPWFKAAKQFSKKVFFTFHLPYLTCYKNDFRFNGVEDCNQFNDASRCTNCIIAHKAGYNGSTQSKLYTSFASAVLLMTGRKAKLKNRVNEKHKKLNELISVCDNLFIYASWFKKILEVNGYDFPNIKKIPYKTKSISLHNGTGAGIIPGLKNKLLFVGRIQYQKGLHLLCKAMKLLNKNDIQLDVFGNIIDQQYFDNCKNKYHFNFKGTTDYNSLLTLLRNYDFLVLPSVFTEMYALIIKDAFYEGLPVIASTAKGNKDAVEDAINGFLFAYDDAEDLATTIDKAYQLKKSGWNPVFSYPVDPKEDLKEILSYYN